MKCNLPLFCGDNISVSAISKGALLTFEIIMILLFLGLVAYLIKTRNKRLIRNLIITIIGIVLFELMINPMVENNGLSSWTYFYDDLSFIVTLGWVFIVTTSISIIDVVFSKTKEIRKFFLYLGTIVAITMPIEIFLVQNGIRVYSNSLIESSLGANIPFTILPLEIGFAIPMFFALVIGFVKYWENILDKNE